MRASHSAEQPQPAHALRHIGRRVETRPTAGQCQAALVSPCCGPVCACVLATFRNVVITLCCVPRIFAKVRVIFACVLVT